MKLTSEQLNALMSEAADKMAELQDEKRTLIGLLVEVNQWIDGWSPNFIYDEEWPETAAKIKDAIKDAKP